LSSTCWAWTRARGIVQHCRCDRTSLPGTGQNPAGAGGQKLACPNARRYNGCQLPVTPRRPEARLCKSNLGTAPSVQAQAQAAPAMLPAAPAIRPVLQPRAAVVNLARYPRRIRLPLNRCRLAVPTSRLHLPGRMGRATVMLFCNKRQPRQSQFRRPGGSNVPRPKLPPAAIPGWSTLVSCPTRSQPNVPPAATRNRLARVNGGDGPTSAQAPRPPAAAVVCGLPGWP